MDTSLGRITIPANEMRDNNSGCLVLSTAFDRPNIDASHIDVIQVVALISERYRE